MCLKLIFALLLGILFFSKALAQDVAPSDTFLIYNKSQVVISSKGREIPEKILPSTLPSYSKIKLVDSLGSKWGIINENGKFLILPIYDSIKKDIKNQRVVLGRFFPELGDSTLFFGIHSLRNVTIVPVSFKEIGAIQQGLIPVRSRLGLWGVYDTTGTLIHEPEYDSVKFTASKGIWVRKNGKWGLLNKAGKYAIVPKYKFVVADSQQVLVTKFPVFDFMNVKSEPILSFECDSVTVFSKGIYKYYQNERCGLRTIKEDSKAIYDTIGKLVNGRAVACKNGKWGLLNAQAKVIIPFIYDGIAIDASPYIRLSKNRLWGIIDHIQFPKIPHKYRSIKSFTNGMAAAQSFQTLLWGYVNIVGDTVIDFQYSAADDFSQGLAKVEKEGSVFIVNKKGEMVVTPADMPRFLEGAGRVDNNLPVKYTFPIDTYDSYRKLIDGITLVKCGRLYGLLGKKGNELFPAICDTVVYDAVQQTATFHCDTMAGVVDRYDNFVHPLLYNFDTILAYHQGCALARKNGYYGGIDILKNIRVAPQYERMQQFHDGKWGIMLNGNWGFTDLNENIVVQPNYEAIQPFNGGAGAVKYKGRWNLASAKDEMMNVTTYDSISPTLHQSWILYLDGKQGLTDTLGRETIVCRYDKVQDLGQGFIQVWKNNKTGVMNRFQDVLIPMIYDRLKFDDVNALFLLTTNTKKVLIE